MRTTVAYILLFAFAMLAVLPPVAQAGNTTLYIKRNSDGSIDNEQQQVTTPKPRGITVVTPEVKDDNKIRTGLYVNTIPSVARGGLILPPVPAQNYQAAAAAVEGSIGTGECKPEELRELVRLEQQMHDIGVKLSRGEHANESMLTNPGNVKRIGDLYFRCGRFMAASKR